MKQWQTVQIPLAAGLDTKSDPRARPLPSFEILRDAEWEETGGLQTRKPYASVGAALDGGGELADVRRIFNHGGELLAFTRDKLYAHIPHMNAWVERAEYLAIKIEESTQLATANDVRCADRAELGGVVVYTWQDGNGGWIAVLDTAGAAIIAPQRLAPLLGGVPVPMHRPRCVALETRILVFGMFSDAGGAGNALFASAIDPAAPAIGEAVSLGNFEAGGINFHFDVCRVRGQDRALVAISSIPHDAIITKGYRIARVDADLTFAATQKTTRVSDGPIAVACAPESTFALVLHANNTSEKVLADLLDIATLGDVPGQVDVELGAFGPASSVLLTQVTAEFRTVPVSGQYRAYVFWTADERTDEGEWASTTTWIDTAGDKGTAATFVRRLGIASRAFERDGRIYLWGAFAGASQFEPSSTVLRSQLQNSYFLYRDDATFHAKSVARAGGGLAYYRGHLPAVQDLGDDRYAWAAVIRRVIPLNAGAATYDAGAIREVAFAFDSDEARRTARIGGTTYIAGGEVLQYDGRRLVELGFHIEPWHLFAANNLGDVANGTYGIKESWRWNNGAGERDRSASAIVGTFTVAGGPHGIGSIVLPLFQTHKLDAYVEMWRTQANPTLDSPFFLTTSRDPADVGVPNSFVWNDPSVWSTSALDALSDADLAEGEPHQANGGYIEGMAPPAATIITASNDRLFLAGVAGDADRIWYTRHRADGEVAAFDGDLTVEVPPVGGAITGLGFLNDTLIVFRRHAVYALDGAGYDNLGGGVNYGPPRLLASDVGAVAHESIALTPRGLVFKSAKGWYLVNRGWSLEYIGAPVAAFDDEDVLAVHVLEDQHQIRCVTSARVLVLDYSVPTEASPYGQWSEWTIAGAVHALMRGGVHHVAFADDVRAQRSDYTGVDYGLEAKLAPIKLNELQGAGSVRWLDVLGEYRGACRLQVQLYRDYEATPYQTVQWAPTLTVVGGPLQVSVGPRIPKCMAIGVHLKAIAAEGDGAPTTEAIKLTGLALEVGIDKGINRRLPAGQKA